MNSTLLSSSEILYDELSRVFQSDVVLFINSTSTSRTPDLQDGALDIGKSDLTPSDSQSIPGVNGVSILGRISTRTEYDRDSRRTFVVEDDGDVTRFEYDGADRIIRMTDPERNLVEYAYDDNGNLIETRETDVSQVQGVASEMFVTTRFMTASTG